MNMWLCSVFFIFCPYFSYVKVFMYVTVIVIFVGVGITTKETEEVNRRESGRKN